MRLRGYFKFGELVKAGSGLLRRSLEFPDEVAGTDLGTELDLNSIGAFLRLLRSHRSDLWGPTRGAAIALSITNHALR